MITEKRLEESLKYLADTDEDSASANANVKYLDRLLKRKKALHITGNRKIRVSLQKNKHIMLVIYINQQ